MFSLSRRFLLVEEIAAFFCLLFTLELTTLSDFLNLETLYCEKNLSKTSIFFRNGLSR